MNVYAFLHPNSILDAVALGGMGLKNFGVFWKTDAFLPLAIRKKLDQVDHMILVSKDAQDSVQKMMDMVQKKDVRNLLIAPEGATSDGLYDVRPVFPGFSNKVVGSLREAGYQVRIIPVAFPENYRINNAPVGASGNGVSDEVVIQILDPIEPEAVARMLDAGTKDSQGLGRLIRQKWMEALATRNGQPGGLVSLKQTDEHLRRFLYGTGQRYCGSLLGSADAQALP